MTPPQPSAPAELANTELTVLSVLRDRRDSSGSTTSSAYLSGSRRSSGISPCFSSRRSSQASHQGEGSAVPALVAATHHRRLRNLSSADSYDPISTDASRRSSEASHCDGGGGTAGTLAGGGWGVSETRGVLSLTPAQHYHLKAKYAAATGGPPPTPLPNMESASFRNHAGVPMEEGGHQPLPPLVRPHRCSETAAGGSLGHGGYRRRGLYLGEGPINVARRASDPVRSQYHDLGALPSVQRFSSLNSLHPLPPLAHHPTSCSATRSEGNLPRGLHNPSITEHAALEALATEEEDDGLLLLADEDMLPDDLVQYLRSRARDDRSAPCPSAEELEQNHGFSELYGLQQQQQAVTVARAPRSPSQLPVQWNEVSSGSADKSPQRWPHPNLSSDPEPFGRFGNMMVQQQQQIGSCSQVSQSHSAYCSHPPVKLEASPNSCMQAAAAAAVKPLRRPDLSAYTSAPSCHNGNSGLAASDQHHHLFNQPIAPQLGRQGHASRHRTLGRVQPYLPGPELPGQTQPRDGSLCGSLPDKIPWLKLEAADQGYLDQGYPDQGYLDQGYLEQGFTDGLPHNNCKGSPFPTLKDQCMLETIVESVGQVDAHLSPGTDQVSSTVDSSAPAALFSPSLDFTAMLEDGFDQSSLVSGALSPSMFHGMSRTSSRLTTPRAAVAAAAGGAAAFHSVAPGLNNMAIGDMSSLLTTLAEENKFLAIMQ